MMQYYRDSNINHHHMATQAQLESKYWSFKLCNAHRPTPPPPDALPELSNKSNYYYSMYNKNHTFKTVVVSKTVFRTDDSK